MNRDASSMYEISHLLSYSRLKSVCHMEFEYSLSYRIYLRSPSSLGCVVARFSSCITMCVVFCGDMHSGRVLDVHLRRLAPCL